MTRKPTDVGGARAGWVPSMPGPSYQRSRPLTVTRRAGPGVRRSRWIMASRAGNCLSRAPA